MLDRLENAKNLKYCNKFRLNLISNLKQRFGFLDIDPLYIHSAILTPKYGKKWMNRENERINFNNDTFVSAADEFLMKLKIKKHGFFK